MVYRTRINYTAEQKAEMWDRWQRGESLNAIGRAFDRPSSSIFGQLVPSGGIRPSVRRRSRLALTLSEREEISRGIVSHLSLRSIAAQLGRSPSTISREVHRNGGQEQYRASQADQAAWARAHRPVELTVLSRHSHWLS
jgi:DNA-binding CsgD family transcriptional regulator